MQKITIEIDGGKVSIDVSGVEGKGCIKLLEEFEKELGKVTDQEYKKEFYQTAKQQKQVWNGYCG